MRRTEPIEAAAQVADDLTPDPAQALARQEAIATAVSRFAQLPILQRSAVVLKDVLGHSLEEIAGLLDLSVNSVKAALGRGRTRLKALNAAPPDEPPVVKRASEGAARFSALFNRRDWDALRAVLADDVRLRQTTYPDREGRAEAGLFFTIYAAAPAVCLVPAYLDGGRGGEVIAVFAPADDARPAYLMQVEWRGSEVVQIRDFRHAPYIMDGADLVLAAPRRR